MAEVEESDGPSLTSGPPGVAGGRAATHGAAVADEPRRGRRVHQPELRPGLARGAAGAQTQTQPEPQHESTPPPRFWLRRDDDAGKAVPPLPGRGRVGSPISPQGGHMEHGDECMRERAWADIDMSMTM